MYGSARFFIDEWPRQITSNNLIEIFEFLSNSLGVELEIISYVLFDPDGDGMLINQVYPFNRCGKEEFSNIQIMPLVSGKNGDLSAPFVQATCQLNSEQLYDSIQIVVQFPFPGFPMVLGIDYDCKSVLSTFTLDSFKDALSFLRQRGCRVNNSLFHIYANKNIAAALDRGQVGIVSERRLIRKASAHYQRGCVDSLMDVFCANSILCRTLSLSAKNKVKAIVGSENVIEMGDTFIFALAPLQKLRPILPFPSLRRLKKLRHILKEERLLD